MKKNNTAQKTALDVERISKALKEGTEKTLRNLIKEAIENVVGDDEEQVEDEPIEDDSFEVQDVETGENSTDEPEEDGNVTDNTDAEGEEAEPEDGEGAEDEWGDLEDFKVGDSDYDFTGVDGDMALKVYNKLGDDDQIFVKKEDDGTYSVKDEESGAELVIELEPDGSEDDADADVDVPAEDDEMDIELGDDVEGGEDELPADDDVEGDDEIEIELGDDEDEENDDELNENLGYTDSYQDKDVISGLKMNEPADKKATYGMDGGAPEGTKKPWAGKGNMQPFNKKTNTDLAEAKKEVCPKCGKKNCQCDECSLEENQTVAKATRRRMPKTYAPNSGETDKPEVSKNVSVAGQLSEAKAKQIIEAAKAIQAENKQIKEMAKAIKQSLYEAAVLNVNYGKIVSLLVNETTTKDEKKSIVERFSNVKSRKVLNSMSPSRENLTSQIRRVQQIFLMNKFLLNHLRQLMRHQSLISLATLALT